MPHRRLSGGDLGERKGVLPIKRGIVQIRASVLRFDDQGSCASAQVESRVQGHTLPLCLHSPDRRIQGDQCIYQVYAPEPCESSLLSSTPYPPPRQKHPIWLRMMFWSPTRTREHSPSALLHAISCPLAYITKVRTSLRSCCVISDPPAPPP